MASLADKWHSAILKNSLDLMRFDAHQRTEIIALLNELGRGLVADLSGAGLDTPRTDWQRARLRELLKSAQGRISGTYDDIATIHAEGLAGAVEASTTGLTVAMNAAAGVELLQAIKWTPEQLAALVDGSLIQGAPSAAWWARQSVDLQEAFADQMRMGMARGEAIGSMTKRVKDLMGISTRNAENLVRTSAMSANNAAHLATWAENADVIAKLEWTATLDPRTCLVAGTPVDIPGGTAPVESLREGDAVIGGSGSVHVVTGTMHKPSRKTLRVTLSNGETIQCTPDHPWLLDGQNWVEAKSLKAGDVLASALK